jgi:CheY-like chemotaxis protein
MSHELRTPLNAIIGFSSILAEGVIRSTDPQYKEFVGHIVTGGRHLLQLINDVLDLSKVEAGKLEFRPEPLDLVQVVGEVVALLKTTIVTKRIRLAVSVDPDVQHLVLDPARLKQVLYNYLSNALKFTPDGGAVQVRATAAAAEMFRLEVEDSGIGIAEADFSRLFQEFQQLDSGAAKQHAGTGLGLALTKRLVESQGGSVGVHSTLGSGSVFYALLPKERDTETPVVPRVDQALEPAGPAILVIEDNPRDRGDLVGVLSAAGYAVEAVATGTQAVSRCQERAFDAITLDLLLPDQSGLDVLQQIRATGKNLNVPVLVVTIIAEENVIAGHIVSDILAKPLDTDALLASLRRAHVEPRSPDRILVVDDDEASARMVSVSLQRSGYNVEVHTDPRAALTSATASPPSVIVLDLLMPHLDGFQFIDQLRSQPATQNTPVIVWSVKDLSGAEHRQLSASARSVLQKGQSGMDTLLRDLHQFLPSPHVAV